MRVLHVCTTDTGAAHRLHKGLLRLGVESMMFVAESRSKVNDPTVMVFDPPRDLPSRLRRRLRREQINWSFARYQTSRPTGYGWFFDDRCPHGGDMLAQLPRCDLINLHTMFQLVDFQAFFATVPQHTPVVRTLHDMTFFTGGCHHDWGCGKYAMNCGACPQLGSPRDEDLSRQIWRRKCAALRAAPRGRLYFATPNRWLAEKARHSTLLRDFPISVIPLGLDTEDFRPRDRGFARETLGIPQDTGVVLFVAEPLGRPEKGFSLLAEALRGFGQIPNRLLVSVGSGKPPVEVPIPHLRLGNIGNERLLSLVYSAADIVAVPSVQDNSPQAALEAIACGTPVVSFAVGGIPDIVRPGITGLLVPARDVGALHTAISDLLQDRARRSEMAANCRRIAVEEYALEVYAQHYLDLYKAILTEVNGISGTLVGA